MTTAKRKSSKPNSEPQAPELATARVHDLVGAVAVALPAELRDIFDDKTYQKIRNDVESHLMTLIIREPGHIVYVHANLMALELDAGAESAASSTEGRGPGDTSAMTSPNKDAAVKSKARSANVGATKRPTTQQTPAKRTAAKAGKSSRRQPKGKA